MSIIRLIYVNLSPESAVDAERIWNRECAPLMIKQQGCLSEKLLKCVDNPGEYISYSEWEDQASIDRYRESDAHEEIKKHTRGLQGDRPLIKRYELV